MPTKCPKQKDLVFSVKFFRLYGKATPLTDTHISGGVEVKSPGFLLTRALHNIHSCTPATRARRLRSKKRDTESEQAQSAAQYEYEKSTPQKGVINCNLNFSSFIFNQVWLAYVLNKLACLHYDYNKH